MKNFFMMILVLSVFSLAAAGAPVANDNGFAGGSGTESDPYLVETAEQLNRVREYSESHFKQTADIDLTVYRSGEGWEPIGSFQNTYYGYYDGNGHLITNLVINRPEINDVGLFGYFRQGVIKNVSIQNAKISGNSRVGVLTGSISRGQIWNCFVSGTVAGSSVSVGGLAGYVILESLIAASHSHVDVSSTGNYIGGLVGGMYSPGIMTSCYAVGDVSGRSEVGGLVGRNEGSILACFATGSVSGATSITGGLVGMNRNYIEACYATGSVSGYNKVGGLVGENEPDSDIINCFAAGEVSGGDNTGGLVGWDEGSIDKGYYDSVTTKQSDLGKGIPKTTNELLQQITFIGWDFTHTWDILEWINYPYLRSFITDEVYDAIIESQTFLSRLVQDEPRELHLTVRNTGTTTWLEGEEYFLGAAGNHDPLVTGPQYYRRALLHDVAKGQVHTFTIPVQPQHTGLFMTEWQMLKEGEFWFGDAYRKEVEVMASFDGGSGTAEDPYLVSTPEQLNSIRFFLDSHYLQTGDIDLTGFSAGEGWEPIGSYVNRFMGYYDGDNNVITNLVINRPEESLIGLFGNCREAVIKNVFIKNANISGGANIGILAGNFVDGEIENCFTSGRINEGGNVGGLVGLMTRSSVSGSHSAADVSATHDVGGLVGWSRGTSIITDCHAVGYVEGTFSVGGLIGSNEGFIISSFATGPVSWVQEATNPFNGRRFGGLVGWNEGYIGDSYATGPVSGRENVGGAVGKNIETGLIINSYAAGKVTGEEDTGGFAGLNWGNVLNCYYDTKSTGQSDLHKGIPRQPGEMFQEDTFPGWDFDDTWAILEGVGYPFLKHVLGGRMDNAMIEAQRFPSELWKDNLYELTLTVRNTGAFTWNAQSDIKLGAVGDQDDLVQPKFYRLPLSHAVVPGQLYTFTLQVTPEDTGIFLTEWRMINEGVSWFGEVFSKQIEVIEHRTNIKAGIWQLLE